MTFGVTSVDLFDNEIPGPETSELPIADYPHLPRLQIESRASELDREQVERVLRYEREHRGRTPVIRLLTARLHELRPHHRDTPPAHGYGSPCAHPDE